MSRTTTAARQIALLASSSLGLALVASTVSVGVALAPTAAAAQAVCVPAPTTGAGTSNVSYGGALYAVGIDCDANGDMTVAVTSNGVDIGGPGIDLDAAGADDITFNSTIEIDGNGLTGALLNATTNSGTITINTAALDADQTAATNMTHGILATSTSGAIDINLTGTLDAEASNANLGGVAGIEARTGGAGAIDISATSPIQGRLYGLWAETTGSGGITIAGSNFSSQSTNGQAGVFANAQGGGDISLTGNAQGPMYGIRAQATGAADVMIAGNGTANSSVGVAGIWVKGGSGLVSITGNGTSTNGTGIYVESLGNVTVSGNASSTSSSGVYVQSLGNIAVSGAASGGLYGVDLSTASGTTSTITSASISGGLAAVRAQGGGNVTVNLSGVVSGGFDFSGLTTTPTVNLTPTVQWGAGATPTLVASNQPLTIELEGDFVGRVNMDQFNLDSWEAPMIVNFTGPDDTFIHSGAMLMGQRIFAIDSLIFSDNPDFAYGYNPRHYEAELRFVGLEEFRHSGFILFGTYYKNRTDLGTDGWYDDILSMAGTHWVGEGGELVMDVAFDAASAADCTREAVTGDLGGADCLILTGGSTEGVTNVTVNEVFPADRGAYNSDGWLLVDVTGGTSAQGHFVLGPNTVGYSPLLGGMMDKGAFAYTIAYDEDAQQHRLVSLPGPSALQLPLLADAAHELWRLSTGSWFERQSDMRGGVDPGLGGGIWMRVAGEHADRDVIQSVVGAGQTFDFDNSYAQDSYAITGGLDLVSAATGDTVWTAGLMVGYASSTLEYDASVNEPEFNSWNGGIYAGVASGPLFVDAAVNAGKARLREAVPAFGLLPDGTLVSTDLLTVGVKAEAGWRFDLGGGLSAEPLAGLSWSRSKWEDIEVPAGDAQRPAGVSVEFDDPTSLRASLGGRLGLDFDYGAAHGQLSLLGRYWDELEGESGVVVRNVGEDMLVTNEFTGGFSEFGVGLNVNGLDDAVTGFFNFGGKFGDDYQSQNVTAGVRVNW